MALDAETRNGHRNMAHAQTAAAHIPPQNVEAEESVLGAMMVSEAAMEPVLIDAHLQEEDFYRDRHRAVFRAIRTLHERSDPVDALTVTEYLSQHGEPEAAGGKDAVSTLASTVPAPGNARHYALIVKQNALLRRLLTAAQAIQQSVHEREGEPDRLEHLAKGDTPLTGIPSGFRDLDSMTGGFQSGNLVMIAARPSMGKCQAGSTLVYDPTTGTRRRLDEVVQSVEGGEKAWVASLGADFKLRRAMVSDAHRNGVKPLYRVTTRLGRRTDATANHPLLTIGGWKRGDE